MGTGGGGAACGPGRPSALALTLGAPAAAGSCVGRAVFRPLQCLGLGDSARPGGPALPRIAQVVEGGREGGEGRGEGLVHSSEAWCSPLAGMPLLTSLTLCE